MNLNLIACLYKMKDPWGSEHIPFWVFVCCFDFSYIFRGQPVALVEWLRRWIVWLTHQMDWHCIRGIGREIWDHRHWVNSYANTWKNLYPQRTDEIFLKSFKMREDPLDQKSDFVISAMVCFVHASQWEWIGLNRAVYSYPRCTRDVSYAACFLLVLHCQQQ